MLGSVLVWFVLGLWGGGNLGAVWSHRLWDQYRLEILVSMACHTVALAIMATLGRAP